MAGRQEDDGSGRPSGSNYPLAEGAESDSRSIYLKAAARLSSILIERARAASVS